MTHPTPIVELARQSAAEWAKSNSRHAQAANILRGSCDDAPIVLAFLTFATRLAAKEGESEAFHRGHIQGVAEMGKQVEQFIESLSGKPCGKFPETIAKCVEDAFTRAAVSDALQAKVAELTKEVERLRYMQDVNAFGTLALSDRANRSAAVAQKKRAEKAEDLSEKYKWQVRDTCVRAEKAEAKVAELEEALTRIADVQGDPTSQDIARHALSQIGEVS